MYRKEMGIGSLTVIMLLVVICLTVFSTLALMLVDADAKLTKKTANSTVQFYESDARGQEELAHLIDLLAKSKQDQVAIEKNPSYKVLNKKPLEVEYKIEIKDNQFLKVQIQVEPYKEAAPIEYKVKMWCLESLE